MKKILKYEIKQLLRDRKTIILVFILPLVVMPLVNGLLNKVINERIEKIFRERTEFVSYDEPFLKDLMQSLSSDTLFTVNFAESGSPVDSLLKIYPAAVTLETDDSLKVPRVVVNFSSKKDRRNFQAAAVYRRIKNIRKDMISTRFSEIGINDIWEKSVPLIENTSSAEQMGRAKNAGVLPVTIIIILVIGSFFISNYVILGEKDNNTLETLLSSGIKRKEIIYGKMAVVMSAGIVMSFLELISFYFYGRFTSFISFDFRLDLLAAGLLVPVLLSFSLLVSSVSVFISCRLKSSSAGQLMFLPVMLFYLVTGLMGTFEGVEIEKGFLLIPVINSAGIMKGLLKGGADVYPVLAAVVSNLTYSFFILRSSSGYLSGEEVLEKSSETDFVRKGFSTGAAFTVFGLLVVVYMIAGGYLQSKEIVSGLILSQVVILGGFCLLMVRTAGKPLAEMLFIKKFDPAYLPLTVIIGLTARYPIALVSDQLLKIFPVPEILRANDIMNTGLGELNLFSASLVIALLPAFFEEFVFRGVFLNILGKNFTRTGAVMVTALMFGFMHMNVFTVFGTGALGVILGFLTVWSGSVFPAVIMHFTNNFFSVLILHMLEKGIITEDHFIVSNDIFTYLMTLTAAAAVYLCVRKRRSA